jgi:hypothetical protein
LNNKNTISEEKSQQKLRFLDEKQNGSRGKTARKSDFYLGKTREKKVKQKKGLYFFIKYAYHQWVVAVQR